MRIIDRFGTELTKGVIVDAVKLINNCQYFVLFDIDKLEFRYQSDLNKVCDYNFKELLDMKPSENSELSKFMYTEIEIVGEINIEDVFGIKNKNITKISEQDILTIMEDNEKKLAPNKKLIEAYEKYTKKTYTEDDMYILILKLLKFYEEKTKTPIRMDLINGFLKDNYDLFK